MNIFSTQDRIPRSTYAIITVPINVIYLIYFLTIDNIENPILSISFSLLIIFLLVILIPATINRFHDLNCPWYHLFLKMVPIYNLYLEGLLLFKKGDYGSNDFGNDPLPFRCINCNKIFPIDYTPGKYICKTCQTKIVVDEELRISIK